MQLNHFVIHWLTAKKPFRGINPYFRDLLRLLFPACSYSDKSLSILMDSG